MNSLCAVGALDVVSPALPAAVAPVVLRVKGPLVQAFTRNDDQPEARGLQAVISQLNRRRCPPQRLRLEREKKERLRRQIKPRPIQRAHGRSRHPGQENRILIVGKLLPVNTQFL